MFKNQPQKHRRHQYLFSFARLVKLSSMLRSLIPRKNIWVTILITLKCVLSVKKCCLEDFIKAIFKRKSLLKGKTVFWSGMDSWQQRITRCFVPNTKIYAQPTSSPISIRCKLWKWFLEWNRHNLQCIVSSALEASNPLTNYPRPIASTSYVIIHLFSKSWKLRHFDHSFEAWFQYAYLFSIGVLVRISSI